MLGIASYPLGRYLWDRSRGKVRLNQVFFYQGEATFAAVGDQTIVINMDGDAPFLWIGLRSACFLPALSVPISPPDAAVMVRYGGRGGRGFSQTPIDIRNCSAPRPIPFVLPCPRPMEPGSQLHVTITLRSAGTFPLNIALQFYGFKGFTWTGGPPA